jgi:transposase
MRPYSEDLRERVMVAIDRGDRREEVAERFSVSVPTITRWVRLRRETTGLAPRPVPGPPPVKLGALLDVLPERPAERADATLEQQCTWWRARSGVEVSTATMSRAIARLGWTRKKSRWEPASGTRPPERPGALR